MIAIENDIMALVVRIHETSAVLETAQQARRVAGEAFQAASAASDQAYADYELAQNALVVASGGRDRSFILGLT